MGERSEGEALWGSRGIPLQVSISLKWYNLLHHFARYSVHDSIVYMVYIPNGASGRGGVLVRKKPIYHFLLWESITDILDAGGGNYGTRKKIHSRSVGKYA